MKIILCLLMTTLLFTGCASKNSADINSSKSNMPDVVSASLQYKNVTIKEADVDFGYSTETVAYLELNFTDLLDDLGISYKWIDRELHIKIYGQKYILDCDDELILLNHSKEEIMRYPLPGTYTFAYKVMDNELILDDDTVFHILLEIGVPIDIDVDYETATANINTR